MEILVVRHGQSVADLEDRHEGRADFELTELGCRQAKCAGKWIKDHYEIDIILSSPLKRAAKTAEFISEETGIDIIFDDELMEWNNGLLAGLYRSEANEKFPMPKGGRKPHDEFAQSESYINFRARAEMFWSKFIHKYEKEENKTRICIVSHGGMINMLFRSFMMLPVNTDSYISTGDTGIHLWKVSGNERRIIFLNKQEHLLKLNE
ncbi:histidine phosphatase family protein [uncultured Tissierella sp.]|jgi:2,3-bisphosphoglycerate-dependent phosphoglycerate mutase|uniref:histidine phosphatase family protein n=1 Tax=Tissierella sp. TaxID=41274 RepID=UPI002804996F|nr:histidine phosphatase family protein [uncultured Tissierella sp.]MDU5080419.1 histidine phosphatase family protein [Bacillota bacterium]